MSNTVPLPKPSTPQAHADTVTMGPPILPIERIRLYSDKQWEEFTLEWADGLRSRYSQVERCGGAGDMGRDVIAYPDDSNLDVWDNYQCKHYNHPLRPGDIWVELGKLVHYTCCGEFPYPRRYLFIAPHGVGTSLAKLLKKPDELRQRLIENWDNHCREKITSVKEVVLDDRLLAHLAGLDFSIFGYVPPLRLIDQHRATPYYFARFGGALPARPESPCPPGMPAFTELTYLRKLLDAYGDHLKHDVQSHVDIEGDQELSEHYGDSRVEFYSAEALRNFSRDTLPEGSYEQLQQEVYDGVRDVMRGQHDDGYRRLLAVVVAAKNLPLNAHALVPRLYTRDRGGICHQLANERENVKWVR